VERPGIQRDPIPSAFLENMLKVLYMFIISFGENGDVIQIYDHKFLFLPQERYIHIPMKGGPCVHQLEWNFVIHKCSPRGGESC